MIFKRLNEIYRTVFSKLNTERNIGTYPIEQYPLLFGICRNQSGDYLFHRFINGSNKRPVVDEFLARLIEYKDQFDFCEEDLERVIKKNTNYMKKSFLSFILIGTRQAVYDG